MRCRCFKKVNGLKKKKKDFLPKFKRKFVESHVK